MVKFKICGMEYSNYEDGCPSCDITSTQTFDEISFDEEETIFDVEQDDRNIVQHDKEEVERIECFIEAGEKRQYSQQDFMKGLGFADEKDDAIKRIASDREKQVLLPEKEYEVYKGKEKKKKKTFSIFPSIIKNYVIIIGSILIIAFLFNSGVLPWFNTNFRAVPDDYTNVVVPELQSFDMKFYFVNETGFLLEESLICTLATFHNGIAGIQYSSYFSHGYVLFTDKGKAGESYYITVTSYDGLKAIQFDLFQVDSLWPVDLMYERTFVCDF